VRGQAFNLGGGPANAVSLRQLIRQIEMLTGRSVNVELRDWRAGDQRYYVSDIGRARQALGLPEPLPWRDGLERLADWLRHNRVDVPFTPDPREQRAEAIS
jgi:CDP-paratose 2-epimerase